MLRALVGVQVEEPLACRCPVVVLVHRAVGVEHDRAPRVVLVVEGELAEAGDDRAVVVPGVGVLAEVQQVARVERTASSRCGRRSAAARRSCGRRPACRRSRSTRRRRSRRRRRRRAGSHRRCRAAGRTAAPRCCGGRSPSGSWAGLAAEPAEDHVVGVVGVELRLDRTPRRERGCTASGRPSS